MTSKSKFRPSPAWPLFIALAGSAVAANRPASARGRSSTAPSARSTCAATRSTHRKSPTRPSPADDLGTDSVNSDEIAENAVASPEVADQSLTQGGPRSDHPGLEQHGHRRQHQLRCLGAVSGRHDRDQRRRPTRQLRSGDDLLAPQRQRLALPGEEQQRSPQHPHRIRLLPNQRLQQLTLIAAFSGL